MKIFNPFTIFTMLGIFLFLGGCQKEDNSGYLQRNIPVYSSFKYKPYFEQRNGNNLAPDHNLQAPSETEIMIMTETMKILSLNENKYITAIINARRSHNFPQLNFSIKIPGPTADNYIILVPLTNGTNTGYISLYHRDGNNYSFYLINRQELFQNSIGKRLSNDVIKDVFLPMSYFNIYDFHIFNAVDTELNEWVISHSGQSDGSGPRCTSVIVWWYGYGVSGGVPFQAMAGIQNVTIDCSIQGDNWSAWGHNNTGNGNIDDIWNNNNNNSGGGGGNHSGSGSDTERITESFPFIDPACLTMMTSDMKKYILGLRSPCDQESLHQQITRAFNEACEEVQKQGGDNFTQTIEMWEFFNNFVNKITKVDIIEIPSNFDVDCPCFDKILKSLMSGSNNFLCNMLKQIDESKNYTQKFKIYDGDRIYNSIPNYKEGTVMIPKSYCEGEGKNINGDKLTDVELGARFIHELMHGYMATLLRDKYPGALPADFLIPDPHNPGNFISNPTYWLDLVKGFNNVEEVDGTHHVIFFTHFKGFIMDALHILNGKIGNPADYEYLAHIIINTDDLGTSPWNAQLGLGYKDSETGKYISTFDKNKYLNAWNNIGGDAGFKLKCE